MEIKKIASAGTMESSDVYVEIEPGFGELDIQLESVVKVQYGAAIEATVRDVLQELDVTDACVRVNDRGALDAVFARQYPQYADQRQLPGLRCHYF